MKNEFKGTKGSWENVAHIGDEEDEDCFYQIIRNESNENIVEVKGIHYGIPNKECVYNTKLIVVAPEMLQVLENIMKCYEEKGQLLSFNVNEVRKVIDKALN